ncbi:MULTISPECIES: type III toxin-antitoxin system TenpIN family toxin [unclassified Serratia (in: enterobacteria)]|uniref:type III toxin-antitoxin system TenpIN family toxin n=1 Tax=unclassified Serratia (in: enterobacteria) TaxID=2647522 RepID=UPI0030760168
MLKVASLTSSFIQKTAGLKETIQDKSRPHGIVTISFKGLIFAIPLRTNLNHTYGVVLDTVVRDGRKLKRGLDFTKALIINDESTDIGMLYIVPDSQKKALINKKKMIVNQFQRYVEEYVRAVSNNVINTINSNAYKYSTLCNYHLELGIH